MDYNAILWILGALSRCFLISRIWMVWPRQPGIPGGEIRGLDLSGCTLHKACVRAGKLGCTHVITDKCEPEARSLIQEVSQSELSLCSISGFGMWKVLSSLFQKVAAYVLNLIFQCALCTRETHEKQLGLGKIVMHSSVGYCVCVVTGCGLVL